MTTTDHRVECGREGCTGRIRMAGTGFCSPLCHYIEHELRQDQRICEAIGSTPLTAELWAAAVAFSDARTELAKIQFKVFREAKRSGVDRRRWNEIRIGAE